MTRTQLNSLKSWLVEEGDFPWKGGAQEKLQFLLRYAVLAQSYYNSQPWRFSLHEEEIHVHADESRWLKSADPERRELYLSIGCALENLLIAAEHFKLGHQIAYFPDPANRNWVARVRFTTISQSSALRAPQLFNAIPIRHTYHKRFKPLPLNRGDLNRIRKFLTDEDVRLEVSTDPEVKQRVSELCAQANTILYGDAGFRDDLRNWSQSGCIGFPWFLSESGQTDDAALLEAGRRLTEQEMQILKSAPAVAVLDSPFDNRLAQVAAGQIFEKLCLEAALLGVRCLPLNQLVEVPEERITVRHMFPGVKGNPLVVFAMGYGNGDSAEVWSPRIPLEEVMAAE